MSNEAHAADGHGHGHDPVEKDTPPVGQIFGNVLVTIVLIFAVATGVYQYFVYEVKEAIQERQLDPENELKHKQRLLDESRLGDAAPYQWVSQKDGVVRIPLKDAIRLTLRDWPGRIEKVKADEIAEKMKKEAALAKAELAAPKALGPKNAAQVTTATSMDGDKEHLLVDVTITGQGDAPKLPDLKITVTPTTDGAHPELVQAKKPDPTKDVKTSKSGTTYHYDYKNPGHDTKFEITLKLPAGDSAIFPAVVEKTDKTAPKP